MNHLLSLSLLVCFCYVTAYPVDVNLVLKNICPTSIFGYKKSVVNSVYVINVDYTLSESNHRISDRLIFKDHFNKNEVKKLETYKSQFNDQIDKLYDINIYEFSIRNFTVTYNRLNEIKKAFQLVPSTGSKDDDDDKTTDKPTGENEQATGEDETTSDKPISREDQLKTCIETVDSGLKLVNRIKDFQTSFVPEGNMTIFNRSIEALFTNMNNNTEQLVFSKNDLLSHIHQIGIFAATNIQTNKYNGKFSIQGDVLIPIYNLNYDILDCGNTRGMPEFFKSNGTTGVAYTSGWASTHLNFNLFAVIQLSILYYFIKSKF